MSFLTGLVRMASGTPQSKHIEESPDPSPSARGGRWLLDGTLNEDCQVTLGERVVVRLPKQQSYEKGTCMWLGVPDFVNNNELWAGIELDRAIGRHNGRVDGRHYFTTKDNCGVMVRIHQVKPLTSETADLKWDDTVEKERNDDAPAEGTRRSRASVEFDDFAASRATMHAMSVSQSNTPQPTPCNQPIVPMNTPLTGVTPQYPCVPDGDSLSFTALEQRRCTQTPNDGPMSPYRQVPTNTPLVDTGGPFPGPPAMSPSLFMSPPAAAISSPVGASLGSPAL